jgi:hypothetical protein
MNLIQIQDRLKSLPNDPRVMQLLTGYANGQSPHVPPYLALGELNRRKVEAEKNQMQQAGQPPGGTVKDQIEQQAGVMALKQGQQQQAMQNMIQQGMQGAAPVPQGTPQPQPQGQVMAAAGGGLASLAPKGYRSGGVIAFKEGNLVDPDAEDEGDEESAGEYPTDAKAMLARLMRQAEVIQNAKAPKVESRDETTKRMIAADPDRYGILNTPVGQDAVKRLDEVQGAKRAELATQREELAKSKPGILQLLGQAAMGTRGQKGGSALASILGGYSELASGADAKQLQQEQGLRMRELELQQAKAEALNKVEDAQRSQAEGNIDKARKEIEDAQKIAKDVGISLNNLLGRQITAAGSLSGRESAANIAAKAKIDAANITGNKPERPTDQASGIAILEADIRSKNPDMSDTEVKAEALRQYRLGTPAGFGVAQRTTSDAMTALSKFKLLNSKDWKKYVDDMGGDVVAASKAYVDDYKAGILPRALMPRAEAKPTETKPAAAPTSSPPVNLLKEGVETKFTNGQTWTLKNGKPVQVK